MKIYREKELELKDWISIILFFCIMTILPIIYFDKIGLSIWFCVWMFVFMVDFWGLKKVS